MIPKVVAHHFRTTYEVSYIVVEDDSEGTLTLTSPSQKLILSSQEILSQDTLPSLEDSQDDNIDNGIGPYENQSAEDRDEGEMGQKMNMSQCCVMGLILIRIG